MKYHTKKACRTWRKNHSAGFSTLEILISTILISTLIAGGVYFANLGEKVSAVDLVSLKTATVVRFPEAIATIYSRKQTLENITATNLVSTGSVQTNRPVTWVVSEAPEPPKKRSISIVFTLQSNDQASDLQTYLDENKSTTLVSQATVGTDANANQVTVKYEIL